MMCLICGDEEVIVYLSGCICVNNVDVMILVVIVGYGIVGLFDFIGIDVCVSGVIVCVLLDWYVFVFVLYLIILLGWFCFCCVEVLIDFFVDVLFSFK